MPLCVQVALADDAALIIVTAGGLLRAPAAVAGLVSAIGRPGLHIMMTYDCALAALVIFSKVQVLEQPEPEASGAAILPAAPDLGGLRRAALDSGLLTAVLKRLDAASEALASALAAGDAEREQWPRQRPGLLELELQCVEVILVLLK